MENMYKEALGNTETSIWVAIGGNDDINTGKFDSPFATIDKAIAACTTARHDIMVLPGEYTLEAANDIVIDGTSITGIGEVTINGAVDADYMFETVFGTASGTKDVTFKNLTLNHDDDATQVGIQLQNTGATAKVNCYIEDVEFGSDGGNSIDQDHVVTDHAIRMYASNCLFEGPVNAVIGNAGDRLRFTDSILRGGLVTGANDYAAEIMLRNCLVLHEGVTGGHASQLLYALGCFSETDADPNVYAALDTSDLAGSHTESVLFPAS